MTPPTISATFLGLLAAASVGIPIVGAAEVTVEDLYKKINPTAALPGFNAEGGSVFSNYVDVVNNGQFMFIHTGSVTYERPESDPVKFTTFYWCSDLTFSDLNNSSLMGYAGRCVAMYLAGYDAQVESKGQLPFTYSEGKYILTAGISAVYVEQLNVFEGQFHADTDDWVARFWDDGRNAAPFIVWEGHDEGDMSPNEATSSLSGFGEATWMSVDEVAQLFNMSVDEFTPETFKQIYLDTWIKDHEKEAATQNPNPLPELEIIEQVKNETNYVDETATTAAAPAQPDGTSAEDDGSNVASNPVVEDDSAGGRQLVSVAARFVSAALRIFGI